MPRGQLDIQVYRLNMVAGVWCMCGGLKLNPKPKPKHSLPFPLSPSFTHSLSTQHKTHTHIFGDLERNPRCWIEHRGSSGCREMHEEMPQDRAILVGLYNDDYPSWDSVKAEKESHNFLHE